MPLMPLLPFSLFSRHFAAMMPLHFRHYCWLADWPHAHIIMILILSAIITLIIAAIIDIIFSWLFTLFFH
jgi:hypothetical protein